MRFSLLDQMHCSCGNEKFRVADPVTVVTDCADVDEIPCRKFCGLRQRPVRPDEPRTAECRNCSQQTIIHGNIHCTCGQHWTIHDGVPSFSIRGLSEAPWQRFRVTETNPRTDPRWEPFVRSHSHASPFHHPGWLRALEEEYGQTRLHLACESRDGRLLAVLPMFYTRGLPFDLAGNATRRRLASLPRTPVGGVLSVDSGATVSLLETAVGCARWEAGVQLQIKSEDASWDGMVPGLHRHAWRPTFVTRLPESPEDLHFGSSANRHRLKWAVNKAVRLGLRVREAETENDLRSWYPLYLEVMRQNAIPPRPYRFFRALWELLRPEGIFRLLLAEREQGGRRTPVAGSIVLTFGGAACYAFTGGRRQDFAFHPNDLIQWQAIHDACRMGARRYDFGEVAEEHQQLFHFKSKWSAEPVPQFRYYSPAPPDSARGARGEASWFRRLTAAGWRRLPLGSTARLGDWIYSYL